MSAHKVGVDENSSLLNQTAGYDPDPSSASFRQLPKSIQYIILTEFCERFSYYGLKSVLALFLNVHLRMSEDTSTLVLHLFIFLAYFCPLLGGVCSDTFWGKYRTILYLSVTYIIGDCLLALSSLPQITGDPPRAWPTLLALACIALGTGGIKPCVPAFGGDQFSAADEWLLPFYFSAFYFAINLGSILSMMITPLIRAHFSYTVAFFIPAVLLSGAVWVFWKGRTLYQIAPPTGNSLGRVISVCWAARQARRSGLQLQHTSTHWVDHATLRGYSAEDVMEVRCVLNVLRIFTPLPVFHALADQIASRWVFQAKHMNRQLMMGVVLQPDQVPVLNPLLIVLLIPAFESWVYPAMRRRGYMLLSLNKMLVGMVLMILCYICASLLSIWIENADVLEMPPVFVGWQIPQYVLHTLAEILVMTTGLEFAYSQAPRSMKSVLTAAFLLTVSIGNLFVACMSHINFGTQSRNFMFFAFLMCFFTYLFYNLTQSYTYLNHRSLPSHALQSSQGSKSKRPV